MTQRHANTVKGLLVMLLAICAIAMLRGQVIVGNYGIQYVTSAPSGTCSNTAPMQVVVGVGSVYTCQNGTWGAISAPTGSFLTTSGGQTIAAANTVAGLPAGCQQFPCLIAAVSNGTLTSTSGLAFTSILAAGSNPGGIYQECAYGLMVAAGSAGTYTPTARYVSYTQTGKTTAMTGAISTTGFTSTGGCVTFRSDAASVIEYSVAASGVTGTPTLRYDVVLMRLSN
jgi:hypothetical protein